MNAACVTTRRRLAGGRLDGLETHLASCVECAAVAERWRTVHEALASDRPSVSPDRGFARRVASRIAAPPDALGWAALRLFPIAAALALVLGGWVWLEGGVEPAYDVDDLPRDLVTWIVGSEEPLP